MLKILVRIASVDMNGFNGRDHHPTPDMVGRMVRVTNMDTVPLGSVERDGEVEKEVTFQIFHGILVDANGEDVEGGEVDLIDFEIESEDDIPRLYSELLA